MGPSGRIGYILDYIGLLRTGFMQVFHLGRAPRTKETLPDFLKWRQVTRHPLVFRGLTGSQRTPGFGVSHLLFKLLFLFYIYPLNISCCSINYYVVIRIRIQNPVPIPPDLKGFKVLLILHFDL